MLGPPLAVDPHQRTLVSRLPQVHKRAVPGERVAAPAHRIAGHVLGDGERDATDRERPELERHRPERGAASENEVAGGREDGLRTLPHERLPLARVQPLHDDRGVVDGASRGAGDGEEDRPPSGQDVRPEDCFPGARCGRGQPLRRSAVSRYPQQLAGPGRAGLRAQDRVAGRPGTLADAVRRVGEPHHRPSGGGDLARQPVGVDETDPGTVRGEERVAAASLRQSPDALAVESAQLDLAVRDISELRPVGREGEAGHGQRAGLQTKNAGARPAAGPAAFSWRASARASPPPREPRRRSPMEPAGPRSAAWRPP